MTRIFKIIMVFLGEFSMLIGIQSASAQPVKVEPFRIGHYTKAIISGNTLYMNDAQYAPEPHQGNLIRIPLTQEENTQIIPSYAGVSVAARPHSQYRTLPFCWDIVGPYFLAMNVEDLATPSFVLLRIPLQELPNIFQRHETELDLFMSYGLSDLYPLAHLFKFASTQQRMQIFFDIVSIDQDTFHLYRVVDGVMTVWENDKDAHLVLLTTNWNAESDPFALQKVQQKSWIELRSFPVDLKGPFRVILLQGETYIFSEHAHTLYRFEEERLLPLIHLPPFPEGDSSINFEQVFVVDKDHQRVIFWIPSSEHSDEPDAIAFGKSASLPEELVSAVKKAMRLMQTGVE